ncbi:ABC transporter substrate-binding protein [Patulibacter sp.]|uniref:ABC transporter substrate-binding protein n=1 Tax=Patulibacter sp. TaxID=1912859 RepID=UPI00271A13CA|nr:ABC transporter substrate-binding protein [Patulibacter sp.]MDO9410845.1 ABC transporter substrate-binding protein [Patulibacter sp.]
MSRLTQMVSVCGVVVLSFGAAACGSSDDGGSSGGGGASSGPIKIAGYIGPAAQGGPDYQDGMKLAAKQINAAGGVDGRKIELVLKETGATPQGAATAYRDSARDKAVIGGFNGSAGALAISGLTDQVKMPAIAASGSDKLIDPVKKYMFQNSAGSEYATSAISYMTNVLKKKSVAVLHYDADFSTGLAPAIEARCKEIGCKVTSVQASSGTASTDQVTAQLTKMKASNPDVYYIETLNPNGYKAAKQLGMFDKPIIGEQWLSTPALAAACGVNCETVTYGGHKCALTDLDQLNADDPIKAFCQKYVKDFTTEYPDKPFALYSIYGYDAVNTFADAARKVLKAGKELTRDNITAQLESESGDLLTSHGAVKSSPTDHALVGEWGEAYVDTRIKMKGKTVTYALAPGADKAGSTP